MEPLNPLTLSLWLYVAQAGAALILGSIFRAYRRIHRHAYIGLWSYGFLLAAVHYGCNALSLALVDDLAITAFPRLAATALSQFSAYAGLALMLLGAFTLGGRVRNWQRWNTVLLAAAALLCLVATFAFINEPPPGIRRLYVRVGWRPLLFGTALVLAASALVSLKAWHRGLGMRATLIAFAVWGAQQLSLFMLFVWQSLERVAAPWGAYLGIADPITLVFVGLALLIWLLDEERARSDETTRQFERLSRFDGITGLANERLLREWIGSATVAATRLGRSGALFMVGVERLEMLAHSTGPGAGDGALVSLAERLRKSLPTNVPSPARLEGQRYAVVLPHLVHRDDAVALALKLIAAVELPVKLGARELKLGAYVGIAIFPDDGDTPLAVIRAAELAMRHAKDAQQPFAYYDAELRDRAKSRLSLEGELREALATRQFLLAYQPIVEAATSRLAGFEALVRWRHPERGLQPPALFLPALEELGLMAELDRWVLTQACAQAATWNARRDHKVFMSVNVTAHSFREAAFLAHVLDTVKDSGLDPALLHLELTEQTALSNVQQATAVLRALREAGVGASLDDFGTGYSSLAQLQQLPVERIKLDRSFIANPGNLDRDAAIVRALVQLAHSIRLDVVAEGIETEEQRTFCARAGVDLLQGYFFSAPCLAERCEALLAGGPVLPATAAA